MSTTFPRIIVHATCTITCEDGTEVVFTVHPASDGSLLPVPRTATHLRAEWLLAFGNKCFDAWVKARGLQPFEVLRDGVGTLRSRSGRGTSDQ